MCFFEYHLCTAGQALTAIFPDCQQLVQPLAHRVSPRRPNGFPFGPVALKGEAGRASRPTRCGRRGSTRHRRAIHDHRAAPWAGSGARKIERKRSPAAGGTEQKNRASFEREDGATRHGQRSHLGVSAQNGRARRMVFLRVASIAKMWREVGGSVATGASEYGYTPIVDWATAERIVQAQLLSRQDDQCGPVEARQ